MNYGLGFEFPSRVPNVCFGDDVVAIENRVCLVAANLPRRLLRDAGANHCSNCTSPKIVQEQAGQSRGVDKCIPRAAQITHTLAVLPCKNEVLRLLSLAQLYNQLA